MGILAKQTGLVLEKDMHDLQHNTTTASYENLFVLSPDNVFDGRKGNPNLSTVNISAANPKRCEAFPKFPWTSVFPMTEVPARYGIFLAHQYQS